jgi:membrane protease YdiL (CAAX protease family)
VWRRWFYGEQGLRAGWCLARFVVLYSLLVYVGSRMYLWLEPSAGEEAGLVPSTFLTTEGLSLLAALISLAVSARLERRPLAAYGVPPRAAFGARFWEGALWGAVPATALIGAIWAAGGWSVAGLGEHGGALASYALLWALLFVLVAVNEEVLFRGYMLLTLTRGIGFWPAALTLSGLFGALHYFLKPMETWADGLATGLLGLFLCYTVRSSGDIWLAAGFHFSWNFLALGVFGGPNTLNDGHPLAGHLLASSFHGPRWLTGGPTGPESSLLIFPLLAALFAACAWRFRGTKQQQRREPPPHVS